MLFGVAATLAELLIPHVPPARALMTLLDDGHHLLGALVLIAVQTAALAAVAVTGAQLLARQRS